MDTIFMNSENSKTPDSHRLLLNLSDKLKRSDKYVSLSKINIYYKWENKKKSRKNKFKISAPTWNEEFESSDGSYSVSDIQDYFEQILKKYETIINKFAILISNKEINNIYIFSRSFSKYYFIFNAISHHKI